MLSTLGNIFSRRHTETFFLSFFSQKTGFDISWKLSPRRQFAWNIKSCFMGKIRKSIITLSSAEWAQRVVKVNSVCFRFNRQQYATTICDIFLIFSPRKRALIFHTIVSFLWRHFHEILKPVFWETWGKKSKCHLLKILLSKLTLLA